MPAKAPHHVSSQEFPNSDCPSICQGVLYETNPISVPLASRRLFQPQIRETNPIYPPAIPANAQNEPNFPHAHHPPTQKCETNPIPSLSFPRKRESTNCFSRNEPNFRIPSVPPPHIHAKRTQSHQIERPPQAGLLHLTPVFQPGIPHDTKKRNEPNFRRDPQSMDVRSRHAVPLPRETNPM